MSEPTSSRRETLNIDKSALIKELRQCRFLPEGVSPEYADAIPKDEKLAFEHPYLPQETAALETFRLLFLTGKTWTHIKAEMQAGKTGVVNYLIRLILRIENYDRIKIPPQNIFVITGMNDLSWYNQTKERLPKNVRDHIYHSGSLSNMVTVFEERKREGGLKNVLIISDESHFASSKSNRPNKLVYDKVKEICGGEYEQNNIKFVTISATDPASTIGVTENMDVSSEVELETLPNYQSVAAIKSQRRIRPAKSLTNEQNILEMLEIVKQQCNKYGFLYNIIRVPPKGSELLKKSLETKGHKVIEWNSDSMSKKSQGTNSAEMKDINDLLINKPLVSTFILIKNMFYASKTLNDKNIGILYDRIGVKDDTNLQSLLGRACGYNKSSRTIIFTSEQTVTNYLTFWGQLNAGQSEFTTDICASKLNKKMAGVNASVIGGQTVVEIASRRSLPLSCGGGNVNSGNNITSKITKTKVETNQDHFESEWSPEFTTLADLNKWLKEHKGNKKKFEQIGEFYVCALPKIGVQRMDAIYKIKAGKKTSHTSASMSWPVGKTGRDSYVGYVDENDSTTVRFIGRCITRISS